jgi:hypothetical protein
MMKRIVPVTPPFRRLPWNATNNNIEMLLFFQSVRSIVFDLTTLCVPGNDPPDKESFIGKGFVSGGCTPGNGRAWSKRRQCISDWQGEEGAEHSP